MNRYKIEYEIFSRIAKVKRCGSCFRCREAASIVGFWNISKKPRKDVPLHCSNACSPECHSVKQKACEWWEPRWYWNAEHYVRYFSHSVRRWWDEHLRVPLGRLRKPVPLEWVDCLNAGGQLVRQGEPQCPYCGEMPYSLEQCVFCGQRFKEV